MASNNNNNQTVRIETVLEYARAIACDLNKDIDKNHPNYKALSALRDRLFVGPEANTVNSKKRTFESLEGKPCSPQLFKLMNNNASSSAAPPSMSLASSSSTIVAEKLTLPNWESVAKPNLSEISASSGGLIPPQRVTSLGVTVCPVRRGTVVDKWSDHEISIFESGICLYGKRYVVFFFFLAMRAWRESYVVSNNRFFLIMLQCGCCLLF